MLDRSADWAYWYYMKTNYEQAMEKSGLAIRAFNKIKADYRSLKIGDAEYLDGRRAYDIAMAEYDLAFTSEAELAGA